MFYHINYSAYNSKKTLFKYKTDHNYIIKLMKLYDLFQVCNQ